MEIPWQSKKKTRSEGKQLKYVYKIVERKLNALKRDHNKMIKRIYYIVLFYIGCISFVVKLFHNNSMASIVRQQQQKNRREKKLHSKCETETRKIVIFLQNVSQEFFSLSLYQTSFISKIHWLYNATITSKMHMHSTLQCIKIKFKI